MLDRAADARLVREEQYVTQESLEDRQGIVDLEQLAALDELAGDVLRSMTTALVEFLDRALPAAYKPLKDRVLIHPVDEGYTRKISPHLYAVGEEVSYRGVVQAIGTSAARTHPELAVGDVVCYAKHSGESVTVNGIRMKWLKAADLLAIIGK